LGVQRNPSSPPHAARYRSPDILRPDVARENDVRREPFAASSAERTELGQVERGGATRQHDRKGRIAAPCGVESSERSVRCSWHVEDESVERIAIAPKGNPGRMAKQRLAVSAADTHSEVRGERRSDGRSIRFVVGEDEDRRCHFSMEHAFGLERATAEIMPATNAHDRVDDLQCIE
jgi:hypothetical protein